MIALILSAALLIDMPGEPTPYAKPVGATKVKYIELLENNSHIIYPLLAVVVVALIAFGVISAWRSEDMSGLQKAELKREIIRELRREIWGMTADALSKNVGVPRFKLLKILEEMQADNILEARTDTQRVTTWKMKGLSNSL
ncbi:MAG: hypothetical protein AMXMBFR34_43390 [Myxococcaceae bacterium]